jgi:hypothetical protein
VGSAAATGTVTLASGKTHRFEAASANTPAGLYAGNVTSGGAVRAASATGAKLKARAKAGTGGRGRLIGKITSSKGDETKLELEGDLVGTQPGRFRLNFTGIATSDAE